MLDKFNVELFQNKLQKQQEIKGFFKNYPNENLFAEEFKKRMK